MKDCLTFEQYCAFDCNRNLVVTAGPGAGKTRVLTERYCHIVLTCADVGIGDILALTFTEKAAEEMKARIYVKLSGVLHEFERKKGHDTNEARRLKKNLDDFSKNRISTIHSFCAHLLREYPVEAKTDPGFVIVKGLTQREILLKAIKAAISSVNEEDKSDLIRLMRIFGSGALLLDAVKSTIEHPVNFKRIIAARDHLLSKGNWKDQVFAEYCRYIKDNLLIPYYHGLRDMPDGKGQHNQVLELLREWYGEKGSLEGDFKVPFLFTQLRELARERPPGSSRVAVKQGTREISYLDFLKAYYPDLFAISNADTVFEQELSVFLKLARISLNYYQDQKRRLNALDFADLEARTLEFLTALFFSKNRSLIRRIQSRFKYVMVDEFQDTNRNQWEILRLLVSDRDRKGSPVLRGDKVFVVGDKRQAIYRFRGADVTVFDRVTEEIKGSNLSNTKPIFWHDKQRLRQMSSIDQGTEKELFDQALLCEEMSEKEKERMQRGDIHLSGNFRSDEKLIRFFNATFSQIFSNKGSGALAEYESEYMPIEKAHYPESGGKRGSVAFYLIANRKDNSSRIEVGSRIEQEASLIAGIVARIMGRAGEGAPEYLRYRSIGQRIETGEPAIGILFFAYTHIKTFETILREAGIPFIVNKGKGFFRCEEVMEMAQLLAYLSDQRERISLLAALRGSLFGLTDPEIFDIFCDQAAPEERLVSSPQDYQRTVGNQILTWRSLAGHLSLPELVRTIIRERGLLAVLSSHPNRAQRMANMEKFIGIARQFEVEGNGSLQDFVAYCLRMADEEEDEGEALVEPATGVSIHLMTIHAAKGLEFPMVIIPELDRSLPRGWRPGKPLRLYPARNSGPEAWNDQEGILPVFDVEFPHADFRKVASPLSFILKRRDALEDVAENRRVFYVGCTRAMHHLILTGRLTVAAASDARAPLSPHDYREGAAILDLLDDIWNLGGRFREDSVGKYPEGDESPLVVWSDPNPREFAGVSSREIDLSLESFGKPDEEIKSIDLTRRLPMPSSQQLSPTSLAVFKRCPLSFYYRYRLNIPEDPFFSVGDDYIENLLADKGEGGTVEGKIIGTVAHAYLEKHVFGSDLDHKLLESVFSGFLGQQKETMLLASPVLKRMKTRVKELLLQAITDRSLLELLEGVRQYSEIPFVLNRKQGYTFRGRIDKLFQVRDTDEWALIDWKTGSIQQRDPIAFAKEHYFDLQLACYRFVVQELKYGKVGRMYLYFVSPGRLIEINYEGNPGREIDEIIGFLERYRVDEVEIGRRVRQAKRKAGECVQCPYFQMGVCS